VRCFHRGAQSVVTRVECLSIRYLVVKEPVGIVPRGVAGGTGKVRILFERTGGGILGFVRLDYEPGIRELERRRRRQSQIYRNIAILVVLSYAVYFSWLWFKAR